MVDPTLAGVEAAALGKGLDFLYAQAGELLNSWRDRRRHRPEGSSSVGGDPIDLALLDPVPTSVFRALPPAGAPADGDLTDQLADGVLAAKQQLEPYHLGALAVSPQDANLVRAVEDLRRLLERIYSVDLTFDGEHSRTAGPQVTSIDDHSGGIHVSGSFSNSGLVVGRDYHAGGSTSRG